MSPLIMPPPDRLVGMLLAVVVVQKGNGTRCDCRTTGHEETGKPERRRLRDRDLDRFVPVCGGGIWTRRRRRYRRDRDAVAPVGKPVEGRCALRLAVGIGF